jgi:hypothetical protein
MLHVSDAAAATVRALAKYKAGAAYNIADDHPLTYRAREVARAAAAGLRPPTQLPDGLIRLVAPFGALLLTRTSITLSTERATAELGWKPRYPSLLDCLGVDSHATEHVVLAMEVPKATATAEPEAEVESEPIPEPEPEAEVESEPTPESESESEPKPKPEPEREPEPESEAAVKPKPTRVRAPKPPAPPTAPVDPFGDMNDAIARIGTPHDD